MKIRDGLNLLLPIVLAALALSAVEGCSALATTSTATPTVPAPTTTLTMLPTAPIPTAATPTLNREALTINFGDYQSKAELTYPLGSGAFPTVVLILGSGPEDLNATVCIPNTHPPVALSHIFLDLSNYLSEHGYAVLRYDKHYVTGPCQDDPAKFAKLDLQQMLKDAEQVLQTAEANPHVDAKHIFLYGWSEGSTIAAALAVQHPELAGLIVQGAVTQPWRDTFKYQITNVGLPYVRQFAPDGRVTTETLQQIARGGGGLVAKEVLLYLGDPRSFGSDKFVVNPFFDRNHDGVIDLDTEFLPNLDAYFDLLFGANGPFAIYAPERALPTVTEQAAHLKMPVLILQGENDANVPVDGARRLDAALSANPDHTLKIYPGLGHSLGPAANLIDDDFHPIAATPLNDLASWLAAHAQTAPPPTPTGTVGMPDLVADFGARRNPRYPIPAGMFGAGFSVLATKQPAMLTLLDQAGLTATRLDSNIPQVFATPTADWSKIDGLIQSIAQGGLHPIVILDYTPAWLQPQPNPCGPSVSSSHAPPRDLAQWADLTAQYVRHFDQSFPGVVQDYEIWNEPDGPTFFCAADNAARLSTYLALYAATAPKLRAQAQADGATIRIGGPALANPVGHGETWLTRLVHDPRTAPFVDFVSYHHYLAGISTATWDTTTPSLLSLTQDAHTGIAAVFEALTNVVHAGAQPKAATTPLYLDEYNTSAGGLALGCCRNDPRYAPLWNALVVGDLLNAAYHGAAAPGRIVYFTTSYPQGGFCLFGVWNAAMDCAIRNGTPQPYPQYYAYELIAGTSFLGLAQGGALADSVTSDQAALQVAAFYTATGDDVLIVNPTGNNFARLTVLLKNAGFATATARAFLLNPSNAQIAAQPLALATQDTDYAAVVDVPAHSVVAVALTGR
jgi:dienelactone hydrolase